MIVLGIVVLALIGALVWEVRARRAEERLLRHLKKLDRQDDA